MGGKVAGRVGEISVGGAVTPFAKTFLPSVERSSKMLKKRNTIKNNPYEIFTRTILKTKILIYFLFSNFGPKFNWLEKKKHCHHCIIFVISITLIYRFRTESNRSIVIEK